MNKELQAKVLMMDAQRLATSATVPGLPKYLAEKYLNRSHSQRERAFRLLGLWSE